MIRKMRGVRFLLETFQIRRDQKINVLWSDKNYVLQQLSQPKSILNQLYSSNLSVIEMEHQIGRFLKMKEIADNIVSDQNHGAIVEFGTWQGLGLMLMDKAFAQSSAESKTPRIFGRYFIGIDTFVGLPESSTVWEKGQFSDTSVEIVKRELSKHLSAESTFELIVGKFDAKHVKEIMIQHKNIALFHFDADLGSSTLAALSLAETYLSDRTKPIYYLFDDWGIHPDEVPDAFNTWYSKAKAKYSINATKISSTRFTRYYRIDFV